MEAAIKCTVSIDYFLKEAYNYQGVRKLKTNFQFPNVMQKKNNREGYRRYHMLFQLYSEHAVMQIIGWVLVFCGLIAMNEIGRRTKQGGMVVFVIIPTILTVYFILAHLGMFGGANNPTVAYMDGWFHYFKLYAADIGCVGFMMIKYKWGVGAKHWFKPFPFIRQDNVP